MQNIKEKINPVVKIRQCLWRKLQSKSNFYYGVKPTLNKVLSFLLLIGIAVSIITLVSAAAPNPGHTIAEIGNVVQGDILYGSAMDVISALAKDANAARYLSNTGASNNPAWAQVDLTNVVTGVLPKANGGSTSIFVVKGTDENVPSGTTLQSDDALTFSVASGETWIFDFFLRVTNINSATPDWKSAVLGALGWTCEWTMYGIVGATVDVKGNGTDCDNAPTAVADATVAADASIPIIIHMQGSITTNSAGSVTLQWAPNTSGSLTVKKGSYVIAQKVGGI